MAVFFSNTVQFPPNLETLQAVIANVDVALPNFVVIHVGAGNGVPADQCGIVLF
jgi:hypothetical protein